MEFFLTPSEVKAAIQRSMSGPYRGADREFYVLKAFRAKFGKDFVEFTKATPDYVTAITEGQGLAIRPPAEAIAA